MGRIWAMGTTASNAATDLADRAKVQAGTREELIRRIMDASYFDPLAQKTVHLDYDSAAVQADLVQARAALKTYHHDDSPDAERFGAPAPMFYKGEVYQTTEVDRRRDGSIVRTGVAWNGPLMKEIRVREEPDGGPFTRVVAE